MKNYSCRNSYLVFPKPVLRIVESGIVVECNTARAMDTGVKSVYRAPDLGYADMRAEKDFVEDEVAVLVVDRWCWWLLGGISFEASYFIGGQ